MSKYIVIQDWMVERLKLNGTKLFVFAIINGFSQDGESEYTGGNQYLRYWCSCSRPTITKALKELVDSGFVIKREEEINGVVFNRYRVNREFAGGAKNFPPPPKETFPNNTNSNTSKTLKEKQSDLFGQPTGKHFFRNSPLSDFDVFKRKFKDVEEAGVDIDYYFQAVRDWSAAENTKKADWVATVRNWMRRDKQNGKLKMKGSQGDDDADLLNLVV